MDNTKLSSATTTTSTSTTSSIFRKKSLKDYVQQELTRGYLLELEEERYAARREKVYTFMSVPRELEKLMAYGFFQCSDAFLFVFTFLPLRCLLVVFRVIQSIFDNFSKFKFPIRSLRGYFKPAEKCDLLKLIIFMTCAYVFSYIDTSVLYHVIKSQSVIKLYIFFNMLEVGDRLFASFVQDTLDALFLTATEKSDKKSQMGVTAHLLLTIASVFGHALVILLQGTTLSVAINANNRALLTVMMSNNFVELKGAVFKKFDKSNLFQVSCSDVRERFHLCILLLIVCVQTMREYSWEESRFWILFPDCVMVLLAEIGVDWLKHAFIARFNEIPSQVYREYTLSLAYDLAQTKQRTAFSDHADMVGRRIGFVPLPLAIVLARVVRPSLRGPVVSTTILAVLVYIALSSFRLLGSIILLGKACNLIDNHKKAELEKKSNEKGLTVDRKQTLSNEKLLFPNKDQFLELRNSQNNELSLAKIKLEKDPFFKMSIKEQEQNLMRRELAATTTPHLSPSKIKAEQDHRIFHNKNVIKKEPEEEISKENNFEMNLAKLKKEHSDLNYDISHSNNKDSKIHEEVDLSKVKIEPQDPIISPTRINNIVFKTEEINNGIGKEEEINPLIEIKQEPISPSFTSSSTEEEKSHTNNFEFKS